MTLEALSYSAVILIAIVALPFVLLGTIFFLPFFLLKKCLGLKRRKKKKNNQKYNRYSTIIILQ